jgi:butyryl-CoA dehydrogenase
MLRGTFEWPDLTEKDRQIRDLAMDVAKREIEPRAAKHDLEGTFVRDSLDALGEAGLLGVNVPKKYGGLGGNDLSAMIALDVISSACGATGAVMCFHYLTTHLIDGAGPEELRQKYLPGLAKNKIGAYSLNEGGGIQYDFVNTTAEDRGDHWLVNGGKPFVTTAGQADVYVCYLQRKEKDVAIPQLSQEWLLIDHPGPGVSAPLIYDPIGLRGASNGRMKYDNVKVPKENLIGEQPWSGLRANQVKDQSAIGPQVVGMGLAGAALDAAVHHVRAKEMPEWMIQELGTMVDRMDAFRYYQWVSATHLASDWEPIVRVQVETKRLGGADCYWICDKAIEIMGGGSLMRSSPIQRYYRDARTTAYLMLPMESRRRRVGRHICERDAAVDANEISTMPWDPYAEYGYRSARGLFDINVIPVPEPARPHVLAMFSRQGVEEQARGSGSDDVKQEHVVERLQKVLAMVPRRDRPASAGGPPTGGPPGGGPPAGAHARPPAG